MSGAYQSVIFEERFWSFVGEFCCGVLCISCKTSTDGRLCQPICRYWQFDNVQDVRIVLLEYCHPGMNLVVLSTVISMLEQPNLVPVACTSLLGGFMLSISAPPLPPKVSGIALSCWTRPSCAWVCWRF